MIVASLLLIPVAVLFLALGLVNGSSSLLIASIVVSLLAAVALVIGTRQAATRRAAVGAFEVPPRPARRDPEFDEAVPAAPTATDASDSAPEPVGAAGESRSYDEPDPADVDEAGVAEERDPATHPGDVREPAGPTRADYADSDSAADSTPDFRDVPPPAGDSDEQAWRPAPAGAAVEQPDEFDEPDADDPDDEPLPQSVRPADAVLVARFDTEVLVVDGRPRYHMADCPHLVGRLTESLPVNEAVELGFSPCGLCRPVDRLVATVAHQR
ncbi:hypothetical protein GCM10010112_50690 [Actinoplanes lobatus]|uniref:Clumping factor A n=1 Tax=Actinoplanes lobatus TaxID=113568 RepID=A0A7W7MGJ2_9ACTN|nr:hypothetical protein [Actinoplanes lobatus]MBB4749477.1 hypothetical protein [Actinoplanes lobatus]GGN77555.1 hypothetical protein GCM10010112_50690 [Actinoplanes lobatus]GIE38214.1 hypothetical protein Alo02nite_11120 [Actinoplanes lobatus]